MATQQNTGRIQTTHIGSLPRPHDLLDIMKAKLNKQPYDGAKYQALLTKAVAESVWVASTASFFLGRETAT